MPLLLLSNGSDLLTGEPAAAGWLLGTLGGVRRVLLFPYAGVRTSWDDYAARVRGAFEPLGVSVVSAHETKNPAAAVREAEAVVVGGGNTFHLLRALYGNDVLGPIRERVAAGAPYVGWSAGSNVAGPTIRTTNDMPVVEPPSFDALRLVPFQINPHYANYQPPGFQGETRDERLLEFVEVNPGVRVVGLPEGTALRVEGKTVERLGPHAVRLFERGYEPRTVEDTDLSWLL